MTMDINDKCVTLAELSELLMNYGVTWNKSLRYSESSEWVVRNLNLDVSGAGTRLSAKFHGDIEGITDDAIFGARQVSLIYSVVDIVDLAPGTYSISSVGRYYGYKSDGTSFDEGDINSTIKLEVSTNETDNTMKTIKITISGFQMILIPLGLTGKSKLYIDVQLGYTTI